MSSLFADLGAAIVSAINAADLAGSLAPRVSAAKNYAPQSDLENLGPDVLCFVTPGPFQWLEATLDKAEEHRLSVYLVVARQLERADQEEIEQLLTLLSNIWHAIKTRINANTFELLGGEGVEPYDPYDPQDVLGQRLFWSVTKLDFRTYRDE